MTVAFPTCTLTNLLKLLLKILSCFSRECLLYYLYVYCQKRTVHKTTCLNYNLFSLKLIMMTLKFKDSFVVNNEPFKGTQYPYVDELIFLIVTV